MREKILFNDWWQFHKGDVETPTPQVKGPVYTSAKTERKKQGPACIYYNDSVDDYKWDVEFNPDKWEFVHLPHDYIIKGEPKETGNPALGFFDYENAWYRKHFKVSEEDRDKRLTLYFEGVATRCIVYLNGCELKHNLTSFNPFEVEITDFVKYGEDQDNVLAVYTYYDDNDGWWYQGGGIYRNVHLIKTDKLAVDLYGVYVKPQFDGENWTVDFETTLVNDYDEPKTAQINTKIIDKDGNTLCSADASLSVDLRDKAYVCYGTPVDTDPTLWDFDNPYLYDVVTTVEVDGKVVDTYTTRTGFRYYSLDAEKGFFLNGKHILINGVCGHGDFGLTGKAVPDNIFRYKAKLMKEMGANGYRCSHYPQADGMMDALDENGFFVMCEARWFDSSEEGKQALATHVKRDRNRPSVFMWSLGNEEMHHITDEGRRINKTLYHLVQKLDDSRIITSAVSIQPLKSTVYDECDAIGVNYNHWHWGEIHDMRPEKPMYISECCATSTTRGWYFPDSPENGYVHAYDTDMNMWWTSRERFMEFFDKCPWLFGFFQWIAFEHRGEAVWPRVCSQAGAIDLFLQKKDAFYQNQAYFTEGKDAPMVHLLPHWNWEGFEGEKIKVYAYTNCDELELVLNGKVIDKQKVKRHTHGEWFVPYEKGVLECNAYIDGKLVATDKRETTGKAVALKLRLDNAGDVAANNQDIAMITCYCVDAQGREVPDACPNVHFSSNELGTIVGTGSSVADHTPVPSTYRKMYAGRIGVAVRVKDVHGELKLFATAEGLNKAQISVEI
ncbi:MAG: DUF4982 domain-containing protein [Clostridia bacterium]|nr:DUF4982 domain-containing protein [Clostridia bacterium]